MTDALTAAGMKIGIPTYNGRVSPVLDTSERLLVLFSGADASQAELREESLPEGPLGRRVSAIAALELDLLVCGALSREMADLLADAGVTCRAWVSGPTDEVLRAVLARKLDDPRFDMPGRCRRRRARGGANACDSAGRCKAGRGRNR